MRKIWMGIKIDLKQIKAEWLRMLLFAISMVLLCLAIGITGSKMFYDEKTVEPFNLAIVDLEDSQWTKMIITTIEQMETVTRLCKIEVVTEEEARRQFDCGETVAIITIPENFVKDIMTGKNTPLTVEKKQGTMIEGIVVDKLITAATKLLSVAQSGIYSTLDCYELYTSGNEKSYNELLQEINLVFAKKMLVRNQIFEKREIAATGSISPIAYYLLSGFIIMMMLSLILVMHVIEPFNKQEMLMRYKLSKMRGSQLIIQKWISLLSFNILFGGFCLVAMMMGTKQMGLDIEWKLSSVGLIASLIAAGSLAALGLWVGMLLKGKQAYGLFIFMIALIQAFLSGGLIPKAFLPTVINRLGYFTYNQYALELLSILMGKETRLVSFVGAIILLIICLLGSIITIRKRGVRL